MNYKFSDIVVEILDLYKEMGIDYLYEDSFNFSRSKNIVNSKQKPKQQMKDALMDNTSMAIDKINDINELKAFVEDFEDCLLKKTAMNTVLGEGDPNSDVLVIGEAPGAQEDEQGRPFVGRSGMLLVQALNSIKVMREKIFITNTVFWRPPGNRNPTEEELTTCYPILLKLIQIINPKIIILAGGVSANHILKSKLSISKLRDKWYNMDLGVLTHPALVRVVFHPSYLLRNPLQKRLFWQDMLAIKLKIIDENICT